MNASRVQMLIALACLLAFACRKEAGHEHGDEHAHEESGRVADAPDHEKGEHEEGEGSDHLPLAGVRGVAFATVGDPQQESVWVAAEAVAEEGATASLSAPVAGTVIAIHTAVGGRVGAGAPLVEIRSPELADLRASLLSTQARRVRAEKEAERERRLMAGQATSQRDLEAAEADVGVARAEEEAARLALAGRGVDPGATGASLTLRAPRAGTVVAFPVRLGQTVTAGEALAEILTGPARLVRVELPLPAPEGWEPGAASPAIESEARRADGRRWPVRVEGVPAALASDTRRLAYRLRLQGEDLPLPGTPLEVRVPLARGVVVPQVAVQQVEGTWGVFVIEGEEAAFRPVRRGAELGGDVLVLAGLAPGERIATEGAYLLKSLYLKRTGGGDAHEH